uniref:DUF6824 domain-containing protein n=1 Tax=Phaeodactylum tricornutum TaxID=2850 RepID=A0A8J9X4D0_PHATR
MSPSMEVINNSMSGNHPPHDNYLCRGPEDFSESSEANNSASSNPLGLDSAPVVEGDHEIINDEDDDDNNNNDSPAQQVSKPGLHDVLLGRGGGTNNHQGNVFFRKLVNEHKMRYLACSKVDKPKVAREVVCLWRKLTPPGRFLSRHEEARRGPGSVKAADTLWYEVGDKKAREKASQCLRERTPDVLPPTLSNCGSNKTPLRNRVSPSCNNNCKCNNSKAGGTNTATNKIINNSINTRALLRTTRHCTDRPFRVAIPCPSRTNRFNSDLRCLRDQRLVAPWGVPGCAGIILGGSQPGGGGIRRYQRILWPLYLLTVTIVPHEQLRSRLLQRFARRGRVLPDYQPLQRGSPFRTRVPAQHDAHAAAVGNATDAIRAVACATSHATTNARFRIQHLRHGPLTTNATRIQRNNNNSHRHSSIHGDDFFEDQLHGDFQDPLLTMPAQPVSHTAATMRRIPGAIKRSRDEHVVRTSHTLPDTATSRNGNNTTESGELTLEEYRQQLEDYIINSHQQQQEPHSRDGVLAVAPDIDDEELEDDWEKEKEKNYAEQRSRGVDRNASGMSMMSAKTTKSNMSMVSGFSGISDLMSQDRETKMNLNRNLSSNLSLMSDMTDLSQNIDTLSIYDEEN